jgi:hypothetical protein
LAKSGGDFTQNPSMSEIEIFHQLTDFCADQNRGFAGSNALIALQ